MNHQKRHKGQWGTTHRYSVFSHRPREFTPGVHHYTKILLTQYCKNKNISRDQARTLIKKKWLGVTRFAGRIFVHEICPNEIDSFLELVPVEY